MKLCMSVVAQLLDMSCRRDSRSLSESRSERKKRLHTSLTELTEQALRQGQAAHASQANGSNLQHSSLPVDNSLTAV